jgi:hypothetical protein
MKKAAAVLALAPVVLAVILIATGTIKVAVRWRFGVVDEDAYATVYIPNGRCIPDSIYERQVNSNHFKVFGCPDHFRVSLSRVRSERGMCYMVYFADNTRSRIKLWCVTWRDVARELRR